MMISIDAGKSFIKIQHIFLEKICQYGNKKELCQPNKGIYNKTKNSQHHCYWWKTKCIFLKWGTRQGSLTLTDFSQFGARGPSQCNKVSRKSEVIKIGKEEVKLFPYRQNNCLCRKY